MKVVHKYVIDALYHAYPQWLTVSQILNLIIRDSEGRRDFDSGSHTKVKTRHFVPTARELTGILNRSRISWLITKEYLIDDTLYRLNNETVHALDRRHFIGDDEE